MKKSVVLGLFVILSTWSSVVFSAPRIEVDITECVASINTESLIERESGCTRTLFKELRYSLKSHSTDAIDNKFLTVSASYKICNESGDNKPRSMAGKFFNSLTSPFRNTEIRNHKRAVAMNELKAELNLNKNILKEHKCE